MRSVSSWIAVAVALVVVVLIAATSVHFWVAIGGSSISPLGWLAMVLGALVTLALGVGLMALVFISARGGYDEQGSVRRPDDNRDS